MIYKMSDADGDGFYEGRENFIKVPGIMGRARAHHAQPRIRRAKREKLLLSGRFGCDLCREDDPERATILQFNADGTGRRIYASGLRNAIGIDLHPVTGQVWAAGNGHDREGALPLPPEWINIIPDNRSTAGRYPSAIKSGSTSPYRSIRVRSSHHCQRQRAGGQRRAPRRARSRSPGANGTALLHARPASALSTKTPRLLRFAPASGNDPGYKVSVVFSEPDGSNARASVTLSRDSGPIQTPMISGAHLSA